MTMRPGQWISGFCLLLGAALGAHAQAVRQERTITVPEVDVRSGASLKFYPTNKLRQGDRVRVVDEKEGGWLAIEPPVGSYSWINTRFIDRQPNAHTAVIKVPDAEVLVGSALIPNEPSVESGKLPIGALVVIIDERTATKNDGTWLPIQPPPQEVRYIPVTAVANVPAVQQMSSTVASPTAPSPASADPLLTQAEQAERAGNLAGAKALYLQLSSQTQDQNLRLLCYNRAQAIQDRLQATTASAYPPVAPAQAYNPYAGRVVPNPATAPVQSAPTGTGWTPQATSQYTYRPDQPAYPAMQPPAPANPAPATYAPPPVPTGPQVRWSDPGFLRRSYLTVDGKPTFVLESSAGTVHLYVTAQAGVNLEPYVNRNVNLYGPMIYYGPVKSNYMVVQQVQPLQP
jgi:uncharacterized protein YgiM (DUF1202 family)